MTSAPRRDGSILRRLHLARILDTLPAVAMLVLSSFDAYAAAPQVRTPAPGFYRLMLGDFEITALNDGTFDLDTTKMLTGVPPDGVGTLLARSFEGEMIPISVNAYLINTGERLILVDAGAAHLFGPTLGRLLSSLVASGYRADQVDAVLITHLHPDHAGGLLSEGKRAFPNATVLAERREARFWLDPAARRVASSDRQPFFAGASDALAPYIDAERFERFSAPALLFPGVRAVPAPGHTPGHTLFSIESKGHKLLIWGDLMELAAVQFAEPAVTIVFDEDAKRTVSQRPAAYAEAAREKYLVAASHLPFPGIGHVREERVGYSWVPMTYDVIR